MNPDKFYDYQRFETGRLNRILTGWDDFRGNHGLVIKFCANLLVDNTVLDVGCGLCHLYEAIKKRVTRYVGIDIDERILEWSKKRHPELDLRRADVYDLSILGDEKFDTVFAVGLYRRVNHYRGLSEIFKHAKRAVILTYLHRAGSELRYFPSAFWEVLEREPVSKLEFFNHNIKAIEILRFNLEMPKPSFRSLEKR